MESRTGNSAQGIRNPANYCNPESKFHLPGIWNPLNIVRIPLPIFRNPLPIIRNPLPIVWNPLPIVRSPESTSYNPESTTIIRNPLPIVQNPQRGIQNTRLERLRFTFTPNGKREFVPRDQVFPLFFVYCLLLLHKNK